MTDTLTFLHFSLGKGGTWGLEQLPQFTTSVPTVGILLNSIPYTKLSKTIPPSRKLNVTRQK